jgi:FixJ family two-component response regulator
VSTVIDGFRRANPGAAVIVCSGHVEDAVVLEGIARNDVEFLQKPFTAETFFAAMDRALP